MDRHERVFVLANRELKTIIRNRGLLVVAIGFFATIVGLGGTSMGSPGGYVSLTYNLLIPVTVLVPVLAFAFGYQSIRGDATRGEVDMIRTYPVSRLEYVLGVTLGRSGAVLLVVFTSLVVAGAVTSTGIESTASYLATHNAGDTVVVYARFVLFALLYSLVVVSLVVAASAASRTEREALALTAAVVLIIVFVLDLGLITLISMGFLSDGSFTAFVAVGPSSAFRGLVLQLSILPAIASTSGVNAASPLLSAVALLFWWISSLGLATVEAWPDVDN
jgi:ABC-2 type transport system permease protein